MKLITYLVGAVLGENFSVLKRIQLDSLCNDGSKLGVTVFYDLNCFQQGALGSVEHLARGEKIGVEAVESVEHFERGQSRATRICRTFWKGAKPSYSNL